MTAVDVACKNNFLLARGYSFAFGVHQMAVVYNEQGKQKGQIMLISTRIK